MMRTIQTMCTESTVATSTTDTALRATSRSRPSLVSSALSFLSVHVCAVVCVHLHAHVTTILDIKGLAASV